MNYAQLIGGGGAASGGLRLGAWVSTSRNLTVPAWARRALLVLAGAGGGGATVPYSASAGATGGNSAPWAVKAVEVQPGDVIAYSLGAGGASRPSGTAANGNPGSASTVSLSGSVVLTVPGGEGGLYTASGTVSAPTPVAAPVGADLWVPGLPAYSAGNAVYSGGAATNLLNLAISEVVVAASATGRGVGVFSGAAPLLGYQHDWFPITFFSAAADQPGVGGAVNQPGGLFAGAGATGLGGRGGGGGGGNTGASGAGGAALGYLILLES